MTDFVEVSSRVAHRHTSRKVNLSLEDNENLFGAARFQPLPMEAFMAR
jgi:hypothetical protein